MATKRNRKKRVNAVYNVEKSLNGVWKEKDDLSADEYHKSGDGVMVPQTGTYGGVKNGKGVEFDMVEVVCDEDGLETGVKKEVGKYDEDRELKKSPVKVPAGGTAGDGGLVAPVNPQPEPPPVFKVVLRGESFGEIGIPCVDFIDYEDLITLVSLEDNGFSFTPRACNDVLTVETDDDEFEVFYCGQTFVRESTGERFMVLIKKEED